MRTGVDTHPAARAAGRAGGVLLSLALAVLLFAGARALLKGLGVWP